MVNIDYTAPISDDDIIGWKSDRGWVYLTLLGVRAPKGPKPKENFSGVVRKIVIDDFDESTQPAILVKKPILGYDIINSKTSPSTIVFIHTEMKKSEVASLKQHIKRRVPPYLILLNPLVSQSIIQILKMRLMKPGKNWALMQFLNTMESYTPPIIQVKKMR